MPTYEYVCKECGEHLEVVQAFTDPPLGTCTACEGPLRKVFGNVGIVFKGSGFYKTDSRTGGNGAGKKAEGHSATESGTGSAPAKDAAATPAASSPAPGGTSASSAPAASSAQP